MYPMSAFSEADIYFENVFHVNTPEAFISVVISGQNPPARLSDCRTGGTKEVTYKGILFANESTDNIWLRLIFTYAY